MKHAELIARLEAAEVGSRELDSYVECASHGWNLVAWSAGWYSAEVGGAVQQMTPPLPYTTSLDAALALARAVYHYPPLQISIHHSSAEVLFLRPREPILAAAKTPALALCIATLRALDANN